MLPTPVCAYDVKPDGSASSCAIDTPQGDGWRWLHFDLGDPALAAWLAEVVPMTVAKALQLPETRPRFDASGNGALINLRGINQNSGAEPEDMVALRIWVTQTLVVTLRRRRIIAMDDIRHAAEAGTAPPTPSAFLAAVAESLTVQIEIVSLTLEEQVDDLEEDIFSGEVIDSHAMLALPQKLIKLKRFIGPQKDALFDFAKAKGGLPDAETVPHLLETANRAARTVEALEAARDRMGLLQGHLEAKVAATHGRNGYVLSIVAAIFLPLGFLTGLFGVNIAGMPGMNSPWAFTVLSGVSVVLGVVLFLVFRLVKWL